MKGRLSWKAFHNNTDKTLAIHMVNQTRDIG